MQKIFIALILIPSLLFFGSLFFAPKEMLLAENRVAQKYPSLHLASILDRSYQDELEQAITDQMLGSEQFKAASTAMQHSLFEGLMFWQPKDGYWLTPGGYFSFGSMEHLLREPVKADYFSPEVNRKYIQAVADTYNALSASNKYLYVVPASLYINFNDPKVFSSIMSDVAAAYSDYHVDYLDANNPEDYERYFLKTDHHWSYQGSYEGYREIVAMMLGSDEEPREPTGTATWYGDNYGILARNAQFYGFKEDFTSYLFDLPEHTTMLNGEEKSLGKIDEILPYAGERYHFVDTPYTSYSRGFKEAIFDYHQPEKENLLLFCDSMGAPILELIASHFNKTYAIEVRSYEHFDTEAYLAEHDIDTVLCLYWGTSIDASVCSLDDATRIKDNSFL